MQSPSRATQSADPGARPHCPLPTVYTFTRELYPGRFRPTLTHSFVKLLADYDLLHTCFTQNIDTLERQAGIPPARLVEAHGSFASQRCIDCKREVDDARMRAAVEAGQILYCEHEGCGGLIKPDIVFFGESVSPTSARAHTPRRTHAHLLSLLSRDSPRRSSRSPCPRSTAPTCSS